MQRPRIAVGSIFIECNHLGGAPADIETFRRTEYLQGDDVLAIQEGTVGGLLDVLQAANATVVPLLVASACPSGPLTEACYVQLKQTLMADLEQAGKVDGMLLALHGAAAAENAPDLEGDLLFALRRHVGESVPIVASLDHHAHVTEDMVRHADGFVAWDTYPHRDAWETGQRAARMLLDILAGKLRPAMALAKVPVLVSGLMGHTDGPGPFADVMRRAKEIERTPAVYSASAFLVHPYLDLPDMGGGGLVVTHGDLNQARSLAVELAELYWSKRFELEPQIHRPAEAIRLGLAYSSGPIGLVETSDCCGGGAAGDSAASLRALLEARVDATSLVPIVDPLAAAACHAAGLGADVTLELGHRVDPRWGSPVTVTGRVSRLHDGKFTYLGGIWGGRVGDMGPSARLEIGPIQVCLTSHATYEWCGEQYAALDMDPRSARFVVVKNPMNYRMSLAPFSRAIFILDTPGPTPPTLRGIAYRNVKRPYFPADLEIPGLAPTVHLSTIRR